LDFSRARTAAGHCALASLGHALERARSEFGRDLPLQTLRVFIDIALHPDTHMTALADRLQLGKSSASRNISALSERTWLGHAGPGLVAETTDPQEGRIRRLHLTRRGRAVAERLAAGLTEGGSRNP